MEGREALRGLVVADLECLQCFRTVAVKEGIDARSSQRHLDIDTWMRDGSCAVIAWFDAYFRWRSWEAGEPRYTAAPPCIYMKENNRQWDRRKKNRRKSKVEQVKDNEIRRKAKKPFAVLGDPCLRRRRSFKPMRAAKCLSLVDCIISSFPRRDHGEWRSSSSTPDHLGHTRQPGRHYQRQAAEYTQSRYVVGIRAASTARHG